MKWCEISVHTTQEAIEPVANILHEAGASGVVIEDPEVLSRDFTDKFGEIYQLSSEDYPEEGVVVKGYLLVTSSLGEIVESIKEGLNNLLLHDVQVGAGTVTVAEVHEEDWAHAWKQYYKPTRVTKRITISPTWEEYQPTEQDELVIELDPGMAFGTGTHPTTVLALQLLEDSLQQGDQVIDVGCGSGVLSIAAVKLGASKVLALDLDEVAVRVTKENIAVNQLSQEIEVKQNNLLDGIEEQAELIVANILAEVILRFVPEASACLKPGGCFITSGIITSKKEEVIAELERNNFVIEETIFQEDWVAIKAKKR